MFVQFVSLSATNTIIEYASTDYMCFGDITPGSTFTRAGEDVTGDISNISTGAFDTDTNVTGDQMDTIVDDSSNVYYKVINYQSTSTTRPTRS